MKPIKPIEQMTEHERQPLCVKALRNAGFIVMITSENRKSRGTKGKLDLLITHHLWNGAWIVEDVKTERGKIEDSQKELVEMKAVGIIHTPEEAVAYALKQARRFTRLPF